MCQVFIKASLANNQGRPVTRERPWIYTEWLSLKTLQFNCYWPRKGRENGFCVRAQIADNFRRNSIACVNLTLLQI